MNENETGTGSNSERERSDQCPDCGTIGRSGWVLGHHYCPECDHTFGDSGEKICDGRYLDNRGTDSETPDGSDSDSERSGGGR